MAIYAIGDLQGCYDSFRRLLDKLEFDPGEDRLWLTGDLVNRGRKSLKTLRYVYRNADSMLTVLGNHDLYLLKLAAERPRRVPADLRKILAAPDCDELTEWLRRQPLFHYDESLNTALVHAGVVPEWSVSAALKRSAEVQQVLSGDKSRKFLGALYGNKPDRWSGKLSGVKRWRFIVNVFTRLRMIRPDGRLDLRHKGPPNKTHRKLIPWFDVRHRKTEGSRIVFGHWSSLGYFREPDLVSLDTGCVWGRKLTALRIDADERPVRVNCDCERR